eukprot:gene34379-44413_t
MPGISFLFKKRFHPARIDNQKKLFIAEETAANRTEREKESAEEYRRERELLEYENIAQTMPSAPDGNKSWAAHKAHQDPRQTSLKFMYSMPKPKGKGKEIDKDGRHYEPAVDENGEDEMVKRFKEKIRSRQAEKESSSSNGHHTGNEAGDDDQEFDQTKTSSSSIHTHKQSQLEREAGRRAKAFLTHEEMAARHPALKNAPIEGSYAKGMQVNHKPFNEVVRNVQCARCGEWGHRSGDRECALKDYNPNDYERQKREDPMQAYVDHSSSQFVDENGESDPEAEFLSTLTRREKKLLMQKLK